MRSAFAAVLFISLIDVAYSQEGDLSATRSPHGSLTEGRAALRRALKVFKVSQPSDLLVDAPAYVRRNRGSAAYLTGILHSSSVDQEDSDRIVRHFQQLSKNKHRLAAAANHLDRNEGAHYRDSLRFDVLRFLVEVISKGQETFHFSSDNFNEAYFSVAEGRSQLFQVVLPPDYSVVRGSADPHPLLVQVFGAASLLPNKEYPFIRVRPTGRGVWGYRAMSRYDVMQVISQMKAAYNIDVNRIYMTGTSAGATGMMHAAAHRPDTFAGLVPLVAFGNDLPLENFRNLPIRCEHGVNDWTSSIGNVRVQFQRLGKLKYDAVLNEHPTAGHGIRSPPPMTMRWLFERKRDPAPANVVYSCEHPRDGKCYWLQIESFVDPHRIARITAKANVDGLVIATDNVRQFSLELNSIPRRHRGSRVKLIVDGSEVAYELQSQTTKVTIVKDQDWQASHFDVRRVDQRRRYAAGAAANLFQGEPLLVIHGTGGDRQENQFLRQAASSLARSAGPQFKPGNVRFPVKADSDLQDVPLGDYNLMLVGSPENHSYLKKIASKLPYSVTEGVLQTGARAPLSLAGGVLSVHSFNPEYPDRLVYVVSPYLNEAERPKFLKNPRRFLAGSSGFKMIDQPDLLVRGADLRIRREMQLNADWKFEDVKGGERLIAKRFSDRTHLAIAHMRVMRKAARADLALWWGPEDKGAFGGYDFNWLPTFDPRSYTKADYLVRRRETECMRAVMSGQELLGIFDRWIATREMISFPRLKKEQIAAANDYRVVIPMDLVQKLGTRRRVLSEVAFGPAIMPKDVADEIFVGEP